MKKIHFIIGFALFGFLWSFIFGLFSHGSFIRMLIIALVFAAVFACLGFLITFLFDGILKIDVGQLPSEEKRTSGGVVDIVVQDEDLPKDEDAPQFYVGENHQMLSEEDYAAVASHENIAENVDALREHDERAAPEEKNGDDGFVPTPLQESTATLSGKEVPKSINGVSKDETLDELPSFQDLQVLQAASFSHEQADADTDFSVSRAEKKSSNAAFSEKDTALMVKAISTVLAKENQ